MSAKVTIGIPQLQSTLPTTPITEADISGPSQDGEGDQEIYRIDLMLRKEHLSILPARFTFGEHSSGLRSVSIIRD